MKPMLDLAIKAWSQVVSKCTEFMWKLESIINFKNKMLGHEFIGPFRLKTSGPIIASQILVKVQKSNSKQSMLKVPNLICFLIVGLAI